MLHRISSMTLIVAFALIASQGQEARAQSVAFEVSSPSEEVSWLVALAFGVGFLTLVLSSLWFDSIDCVLVPVE